MLRLRGGFRSKQIFFNQAAGYNCLVMFMPPASLRNFFPSIPNHQQPFPTTPQQQCRTIATHLGSSTLDIKHVDNQLPFDNLLHASFTHGGRVAMASHADSHTRTHNKPKLHLLLRQTHSRPFQIHDQPFSVASFFKGRAPEATNAPSLIRVTLPRLSHHQSRLPDPWCKQTTRSVTSCGLFLLPVADLLSPGSVGYSNVSA